MTVDDWVFCQVDIEDTQSVRRTRRTWTQSCPVANILALRRGGAVSARQPTAALDWLLAQSDCVQDHRVFSTISPELQVWDVTAGGVMRTGGCIDAETLKVPSSGVLQQDPQVPPTKVRPHLVVDLPTFNPAPLSFTSSAHR